MADPDLAAPAAKSQLGDTARQPPTVEYTAARARGSAPNAVATLYAYTTTTATGTILQQIEALRASYKTSFDGHHRPEVAK